MGAFGSACRRVVSEYGITYRAIASATNYDVSYVSKWVNSGIIPASSAAKEVCVAIAKAAVGSSGEGDPERRMEEARALSTRLYDAYRADERLNEAQQAVARQPRGVETEIVGGRSEKVFSALSGLRSERDECKLTIFVDLSSLDDGEIMFLIDVLDYVRDLDFTDGRIYLVLNEDGIDKLDGGVKLVELLNLFMISSRVRLLCYRGLVSNTGMAILGDTFLYTAQCWGHGSWLFESLDFDRESAMRHVSQLSRDLMPTARKLFFDAPHDSPMVTKPVTGGEYWRRSDRFLLGTMSAMFCDEGQLKGLDAIVGPEAARRCWALSDDLVALLDAGRVVRCVLYRQACDDFVCDGTLLAGGVTLTVSPEQRLRCLNRLISLLERYPNLQVKMTDTFVVKRVRHRFLPSLSLSSRFCSFVTFPVDGVMGLRVVKDRGTRKAMERGFDNLWEGDGIALYDMRGVIAEYYEDCEALMI